MTGVIPNIGLAVVDSPFLKNKKHQISTKLQQISDNIKCKYYYSGAFLQN